MAKELGSGRARRDEAGPEASRGRRGSGDRAVYIISVAAELAGMHPQTLRIYERRGLVKPARTGGNTRRYSDRDIERLQEIQRLTQGQGINLAGVKMIVEMEQELERMRVAMVRLREELTRARQRARAAGAAGRDPVGMVPLRSVRLFPWQKGPS